jgi:hypothetical protein
MEKILIFGNSQLAEVVSYYINNDSKYEICGYVIDDDGVKRNIDKPTLKSILQSYRENWG